MIISRTPLRVSFCGGGSDLPQFYRHHGGAVLSMSIKRYVYLAMHDYFGGEGYILKYSKIETPGRVEDIEHRILRQVFGDYGIHGVDFNSSADVPAGTGLGSSSAFTVGLLNLCNAYLGHYESATRLAEKACDIELNKLGEPIGKQDQYGCALGGMNFLTFNPDESVECEVVPITIEMRHRLESCLTMFYLGGTRSASALLAEQGQNLLQDSRAIAEMKALVASAYELRRQILGDVDVLGQFLHEGWERKRHMASGISNSLVDDAYARARAAGATGGKLLGAGGSGFLLTYTPPEKQESVRQALSEYRPYDVRLDTIGSTIIYAD